MDLIPTSLVKQCLNDLVLLITTVINVSLTTGTVLKQFKQVVVVPLLKKPGLDTIDLKHFRPLSNLPLISKLLEKVVPRQLLISYLEMHQSAFSKDLSMETAVLSVLVCLLLKADERLVSLLALLDLSAAFNMLFHSVLLKR